MLNRELVDYMRYIRIHNPGVYNTLKTIITWSYKVLEGKVSNG